MLWLPGCYAVGPRTQQLGSRLAEFDFFEVWADSPVTKDAFSADRFKHWRDETYYANAHLTVPAEPMQLSALQLTTRRTTSGSGSSMSVTQLIELGRMTHEDRQTNNRNYRSLSGIRCCN